MALAGIGLYATRSHSAEPGGIEVAHTSAGHLTLQEQPSMGLCPWRDPQHDRALFFPTATETREETLILSGKRPEVAKQLGRPGTGEENALKVYRILHQDQFLGSIVARRVRGESGVIELLLAVRTNGEIVGAKIQRLREPDAVATALQSSSWLGAFTGKTRASAWRLGADIPDVPPAARTSAAAVLDAAHTLLVLLAIADETHTAGAAHL